MWNLMTQSNWRRTGLLTLLAAAVMAWFGAQELDTAIHSTQYWIVYWGLFGVLLAVSVYVVILDIQYIRVQYALGKRELFRQTLGNEDFRKGLTKSKED